jgi:hypothetical protein
VSALDALAEVVAWIEPVAGGWRYLLSRDFRAQTHESWRHESIGYIVWDVFWGFLGIAASLTAGYFVIALMWRAAAP